MGLDQLRRGHPMTTRSTHMTRWVPVLALALLAAACGGDTTPTTTAAVSAATTVASPDTTSVETTSTTAAPETTTTTVAVTSSADCLVGAWELDSAAFLETVFAETADEAGDDFTATHGGGSYVVTLFEDGTFDGLRDNWQMRFGSSEGVFVTTLNGSEEGTWSTDGNTLSISTDVSDVAVTQALEVDGELQELPFSGTTQTVRTDAFEGEGTFTCDSDRMTVTFEGVTSILDRT